VFVIKVKVTVTKNKKFRFRLITLLWLIDTILAVWVAYIKSQLAIATQVSVFKVKVTVTKIEIQFLLKYFSLLWHIDTKLGVWVGYSKAQLWIATHVSVIKVNVAVTKNRKVRFRSITLVCLCLLTPNLLFG